ncbi:MAG: DsbA family protein [Alphaproteobacteria bacterium]|nr:DsbA family protein [Alphaproteobacteria bacterium]
MAVQPTRRAILATLAASAATASAGAQSPAHLPNLAERALGNPNAKVTVVEYHSFTCHVCQKFKVEVYPEFKAKFVEPGHVRFVMRDFPLDRVALMAAQVSRCVPADRYFSFVALLYSRQDSWKGGHGAGNVDTPAVLRQFAGLAGATPAQVDRCLADESLARAIVQEAQTGAERYAIRATPTFVIGDRVYSGLQTVPDFERLVAPLLRG